MPARTVPPEQLTGGQAPFEAAFARMARQVEVTLGDVHDPSTRVQLFRSLPLDPMAWLMGQFPTYFQSVAGEPVPLAPHQAEFWQWLWALRPGVAQHTFIAIWPRGGGKSTSTELGATAVGYFGLRRYGLYVSSVQKQADDHVANVASALELLGVERAVNRYGFSRGWSINRLRTADGFTLDAIGMDAAVRGVRIEEARPDLILLDDLDDELDSLVTIAKKVSVLTQKILPTGAGSLAVVGVQNLPNKDGIFASLADGRAEYLMDRHISGPHPALRDLPETDWYEQFRAPSGRLQFRITAGTPVWQGQDLPACERLLNLMGVRSFLIECHPAGTRLRVGLHQVLPIEQIQPGMVVTTHTGAQRQVTQTMSRLYTGAMIGLKRCGKSEPLMMTATHPVLVARRPSSRRWWLSQADQRRRGSPGRRNTAAVTYEWVEAQTVRKGDFLVEPLPTVPEALSDGRRLWAFQPKGSGRPARGTHEIFLTPALARLLGYYLAEGCPLSRYVVTLTFHANETAYVEDVVALFEKVFGIRAAVRESNGQSLVVVAESAIVAAFFQWIGRGSRTKTVPDWMFTASQRYVEQLLIGYMRGDGCKDPSGFSYNSVSEQLAEDIRLLLLRVGIVGHAYKLKPRTVRLPQGTLYERSEHWQGDINGGFAALLGELLDLPHPSLGRNQSFIANGYVHYPVTRVMQSPVENLPVYNCEVEDDHSFLAEGVASHNCQHKIALLESELFRREWFPLVSDWPREAQLVRYWDFASTEVKPGTDPDWTVGLLVGLYRGQFWVIDMQRMRGTPEKVEQLVKATAHHDGRSVPVWLEEEGGSSGKIVTSDYRLRVLVGFSVYTWHSTGSKAERAKPVSSAAEAGNVMIVKGYWNNAFLDEIGQFGIPGVHDDICLHPSVYLPVLPHDGMVEYISYHHAERGHMQVRQAETLKEGDKVLTHTGRWQPIRKVMVRSYSGDVVTIKPQGGFPVTLTPEHPVLCIKNHCAHWQSRPPRAKGAALWIPAQEVHIGDTVLEAIDMTTIPLAHLDLVDFLHADRRQALGKRSNAGLHLSRLVVTDTTLRFANPRSHPLPRRIPVTEDLCRLLGYYVAEGSRGRHNVSWAFHINETAYHEDLARLLADLFTVVPSWQTHTNCRYASVSSWILHDFFGQFGHGALQKHIPNWIMHLPLPLQQAFLIGLWRGDGCFDSRGAGVYVTASRLLALQLRNMLYRFGIVATMSIGRPHGTVDHCIGTKRVPFSHPLYHVRTRGFYACQLGKLLGWSLPTQPQSERIADRIIDGYVQRRVRKVSVSSYEGPVYNYDVEEDHTYQTESFLVHNCDALSGAHYALTLGGGQMPQDMDMVRGFRGLTMAAFAQRATETTRVPASVMRLWSVDTEEEWL